MGSVFHFKCLPTITLSNSDLQEDGFTKNCGSGGKGNMKFQNIAVFDLFTFLYVVISTYLCIHIIGMCLCMPTYRCMHVYILTLNFKSDSRKA